MKRIILTIVAVSAAFVGLRAQVPGDEQSIIEAAGETYLRYLQWKGEDETIVFPIISDVHMIDFGEQNKHIRDIVWTDQVFGYDFMVFLGDMALNKAPLGKTHEEVEKVMLSTRAQMGMYPGVFLYAPGNHDWDNGDGTHLTSAFLSNFFQKPSERFADGNLHIVKGRTYGYYDMPEKGVRFVFLNSQGCETEGGHYYNFDDEQLLWLADLMNSTPKNLDLFLMAHYMPHRIGRWQSSTKWKRPDCERVVTFLEDYQNHRKGTDGNISWNFKKAKATLIGLFCGDTHANAYIREDGVNFYITQGFQGAAYDEMLPEHKVARFWPFEQCCCDIVAIKPETHEVATFRFGAGGEEFDYHFGY
ncbi:MAG: metallophosphoesterase [Bacteroidales bacterium]|nr:metallophosphoesterase [Bacteroidales bacterium]